MSELVLFKNVVAISPVVDSQLIPDMLFDESTIKALLPEAVPAVIPVITERSITVPPIESVDVFRLPLISREPLILPPEILFNLPSNTQVPPKSRNKGTRETDFNLLSNQSKPRKTSSPSISTNHKLQNMTITSAADAASDSSIWSTKISARQARALKNPKPPDPPDPQNISSTQTARGKMGTSELIRPKLGKNSTVAECRFPKYANDPIISSQIHQLHRYVHQEVKIDLTVELFVKLRNAALEKTQHPFENENWWFPYSKSERANIPAMGYEDSYEEDTCNSDDHAWNLTDEDSKFRLLAMIKTWIYGEKLARNF
jgi:hypothetical protein